MEEAEVDEEEIEMDEIVMQQIQHERNQNSRILKQLFGTKRELSNARADNTKLRRVFLSDEI